MKLGIAVPNLGPNQLTYYLVRNANAALRVVRDLDIIVFFEASSWQALPANFATMPAYEAWGFDGDLIATTFDAARKALTALSPARKFFYVWDLEWLRPWGRRPFRELADVYASPELTLLARSAEHARVLEECWGRPVLGVVDDFNIQELLALLGHASTREVK